MLPSLKKRYMEMANFYFLETQKKCPGSLYYPLLTSQFISKEGRDSSLLKKLCCCIVNFYSCRKFLSGRALKKVAGDIYYLTTNIHFSTIPISPAPSQWLYVKHIPLLIASG